MQNTVCFPVCFAFSQMNLSTNFSEQISRSYTYVQISLYSGTFLTIPIYLKIFSVFKLIL